MIQVEEFYTTDESSDPGINKINKFLAKKNLTLSEIKIFQSSCATEAGGDYKRDYHSTCITIWYEDCEI